MQNPDSLQMVIDWAFTNNYIETATVIITDQRIVAFERTDLMHVMSPERLPVLSAMLDHVADINMVSVMEGTALQWAVNQNKSLEVLQLLLDHWADPNLCHRRHEPVIFEANSTWKSSNYPHSARTWSSGQCSLCSAPVSGIRCHSQAHRPSSAGSTATLRPGCQCQ